MRRRGWGIAPAACLLGAALATLACALWCARAHYAQLSQLCEAAAQAAPGAEPALREAFAGLRASPAAPGRGGALLAGWGYRPGDFVRLGAPLAVCASCLALGCLLAFLWARSRRMRLRARAGELGAILSSALAGREAPLLPPREDALSPLQDGIEKAVGELRRTRDQALEARARYAENLENIAHQLKTPLAAADAALQALSEDGAAPERIRRQLARLRALEEGLLALAKLDSGALALKREPVDAYTALSVAADGLAELCAARGVRIDVAEGAPVSFAGDLEWTVEALSNLMKNCVEHSPAGGTVCCEYGENPLYVELRVRDEGPGFARGELVHLFERFYRGERGAPDGAGIGLALAKSVVEAQQGAISARNLPGGGACFEIRMYRH